MIDDLMGAGVLSVTMHTLSVTDVSVRALITQVLSIGFCACAHKFHKSQLSSISLLTDRDTTKVIVHFFKHLLTAQVVDDFVIRHVTSCVVAGCAIMT